MRKYLYANRFSFTFLLFPEIFRVTRGLIDSLEWGFFAVSMGEGDEAVSPLCCQISAFYIPFITVQAG